MTNPNNSLQIYDFCSTLLIFHIKKLHFQKEITAFLDLYQDNAVIL